MRLGRVNISAGAGSSRSRSLFPPRSRYDWTRHIARNRRRMRDYG